MVLGIREAFFSGYQYYDTPDGKDCAKKVFRCLKYGLAGTFVFGTFDSGLFNIQNTVRGVLTRYAYWGVPMGASAACYGTITCLATNLRGKDDAWNSILGGASAGLIWGVKFSHLRPNAIGHAVVVFAIAGFFAKIAQMNGVKIFPPVPSYIDTAGSKNPYSWKQDVSTGFYKNVPRNLD